MLKSILLAVLLTLLSACAANDQAPVTEDKPLTTEADKAHTSRNALDWGGVYEGVLPCADCEGIQTRLMLSANGNYQLSETYLGEDRRDFQSKGEFEWLDDGLRIRLLGRPSAPGLYQVGENQLFHLDQDGQRIRGELASAYRLAKQFGSEIVGVKWQLTELMGQQIANDAQKPVYFTIGADMQVTGFAGCNRFFGKVNLEQGQRLAFGKMASTMMACPALQQEGKLLKALEMADNCTLQQGILSLNKARMAPLARFRAN
ncbi:copper resistance protein NlpE N-terminal domain-containing protein [Lacimicrobium sp. SS2-24]|uniref:copper resistance protein NlpE N-terminal domain-containing protein n=1 Tax=Lacimicrobium sp. SS2-24 TaxID=2005569 RepID=UPI000B4C073A|nr:copper resistance protein NlpE N-terminal domain-containing protein [Lacimicrobium sp. SS2-24]